MMTMLMQRGVAGMLKGPLIWKLIQFSNQWLLAVSSIPYVFIFIAVFIYTNESLSLFFILCLPKTEENSEEFTHVRNVLNTSGSTSPLSTSQIKDALVRHNNDVERVIDELLPLETNEEVTERALYIIVITYKRIFYLTSR